MQPESRKFLTDVREAVRSVCTFTTGRALEDFKTDNLLKSAVYWQFAVIGEALSQPGEAPEAAVKQAILALQATGLLDSFSCADLIRRKSGEWLVLEVGTDGVYNHVDREVSDSQLADAIDRRLAVAFERWIGQSSNL